MYQGKGKVHFLIPKNKDEFPDSEFTGPVGSNKEKDKVNEKWKRKLANGKAPKATKKLIL